MKSLVVLTALLFVGCSVEVAHETENKAQTESLSTFDKNKTIVAVGILEVPETSPTAEHTEESATSSSERSQTTVNVVMPKVITTPTPPALRCPEPTIQVTGSGNAVVLGDVHLHHHEHLHFHQAPKPHPVRIDVRVELGDRFSEREERTRMVERRIAKFFPHYRD